MARIFISYKRVDRDKVFKIKDQIESALGEKCWIDLDGIESDAQFKNVIIKAINDCEIVLFMYSKAHSNIVDFEKDWTVRELNFAHKRGKRIVFINLDRSVLSDVFEFDYGTKQQVDGMSKESLHHLCEDVSKWLGIKCQNSESDLQGSGLEVSKHYEASSNDVEMAKQGKQNFVSKTENSADGGCFVGSLITPYRNKLFSYSKTAASCVVFLLIIQIALILVGDKVFSPFYYNLICNVLSVVYCALWIVLFALITKGAVKNSPLSRPSNIVMAGYILFVVCIILFNIGFVGIYDSQTPFVISVVNFLSSVVNYVIMAATVIGFIWLSKFFCKRFSAKSSIYYDTHCHCGQLYVVKLLV